MSRVKAADWATGFFGAALIGLLWAPWFNADGTYGAYFNHATSPRSSGGNAWQSMAINDIVLLIAGLAGIWVLVATATQATPAVPIASTAFAIFGGLIASALVAVRLIWPPDLGPGPTARGSGAWLALDAAIGLTLAALVSMRDERRSAPAPVPITTLPGEA